MDQLTDTLRQSAVSDDTVAGKGRNGRFKDPHVTGDGLRRAFVPLTNPDTLWFNTGSLCNIACKNCYIESSPRNNRLAYLTLDDVRGYLDELLERGWPVETIGLTGGEPFMNPSIIPIMKTILARGYRIILLTNAMRPMMRKQVLAGLEDMVGKGHDRVLARVSIDHFTASGHDHIRGKGSFAQTLHGMKWLQDNGYELAVAGRQLWDESEEIAREGYGRMFRQNDFNIDPADPTRLVLFPEMDIESETPEITEECWDILGKSKSQMMCSTSRMVIKRRNADRPVVVSCTLLPYSPDFELGTTLAEAERGVNLNHPFCSQFCVLGSASCQPNA